MQPCAKSEMLSAQDLMLILNPWGFDVSDLSPDTRASVHLSAFLRLSTRFLGMLCPDIGSEAVIWSPHPALQRGPLTCKISVIMSLLPAGHGVEDRLVPAMMTEALQRLMPGSHMHLQEGASVAGPTMQGGAAGPTAVWPFSNHRVLDRTPR